MYCYSFCEAGIFSVMNAIAFSSLQQQQPLPAAATAVRT
jgi:hypothetical protein